MNTKALAYMQAKSSKSGIFLGDDTGVRKGREKWSAVLAVRFRGERAQDTGQKGDTYSATKHEPITVIREWRPSTAQFLEEVWNTNRHIDEVLFEFVRYDASEQEHVFATMKLTNVVVAHVELRFGNTAEWREGSDPEPTLEHIGLVPQAIEFKVKGSGGDAVANYEKNAS
ncbi:type VI secretion system tube protein Hcp [Pendulispora albinea]|uniref:Type VI secretion system tube protein Hcp n=1 Tax=Pendulispora albinea TaxID=2741071 RepID=A0ABZ2LPG1_9BACT